MPDFRIIPGEAPIRVAIEGALVEGHVLDGCGHRTRQERPGAVNDILVSWLERQR